MSDTNTAEMVRDAVVAHYIETGEAADAATLATRLGWSVTKVRRVITENHGSVPGVQPREEGRPSYSKSYRGMQSGTHKVWTYRPSLPYMRELLIAARAAAASNP